MTPKTFIFIGRSGCGKGTQAKLLMGYLKENDPKKEILYIYTGDQFREFIKGDSETQRLSKKIYDLGGLQPEFLATYMWTSFLVDKYNKNEHLIFDGAPRKHHEAGVLNSAFEFYDLKEIYLVNINVTREESIKRLMARKRFDDNEEDIEARLSWYDTEVVPVIEYYKNNSFYNFIAVNGEQSIEKIHQDIIKQIDLI